MHTYQPNTNTAIAGIGDLGRLLYFRQSMLHDYMTCPQMALYRWVMGLEQKQTQFLAAFLGTAGHEVVYTMHKNRRFDYTWLELMEMFEIAFWKAINSSPVPPTIPKDCNSVGEAFSSKVDDYIVLLEGYQADPRNQEFYPVMYEQAFVLEVEIPLTPTEKQTELATQLSSGKLSSGKYNSDLTKKYLFTGQLDLAGFTKDGNFSIRDYKFRDNAFKPNKTALDLELQFSLYALACVKGNPACETCRPRYEEMDTFEAAINPDKAAEHGGKKIVYNGPCSDCKSLMETKRWPRRYASPCTLIWMNDYERHKKDQHEKMTPDKNLPKIKGGKSGNSWVNQLGINPKWGSGYKKGDYISRCHYDTYRDPQLLDTLLGDIIRICDAIKNGEFYRRPGEQCGFWCKFREPCLSDIKLQVNEKFVMETAAFASEGLD